MVADLTYDHLGITLPQRHEILACLRKVFDALDHQGLPYAIWESMESVAGPLVGGAGDVDVLVAWPQHAAVASCLAQAGFVFDHNSPENIGNDLNVFRVVDVETGSAVMLHLHVACRFGPRNSKPYRFPHEQALLARRVWVHGIAYLDPEDFLITRLLATVFKGRLHDVFLQQSLPSLASLPASARAGLDAVFRPCSPVPVLQIMGEIAQGLALDHWRRTLRPLLRVAPNRRRPRGGVWATLARRLLGWRRPRLAAQEIVLLGDDGAGQSSIAQSLAQALAIWAPARVVYQGHNYRWQWLNVIWSIYGWMLGRLRQRLGCWVIYERGLLAVTLKYGSDPRQSVQWLRTWAGQRGRARSQHNFLLIAAPAIAAQRDGGLSAVDIQLRRDHLLRATPDTYRVIDTSGQTVAQITGAILSQICQRMAARQRIPQPLSPRRPRVLLVLGPDGAGKTTLCQHLLSSIGRSRSAYFGQGQTGWVIPGMRRLTTALGSCHYRLRTLLRDGILLPLELVVRRWRMGLGGDQALFVIDRFPGHPFLHSRALRQWYRALLPRPDCIVVLGGDAAVIAERRPDETSLERTRRELGKWQRVAALLRRDRILHLDSTRLSAAALSATIRDQVEGP